jgi:hypothetical protein
VLRGGRALAPEAVGREGVAGVVVGSAEAGAVVLGAQRGEGDDRHERRDDDHQQRSAGRAPTKNRPRQPAIGVTMKKATAANM